MTDVGGGWSARHLQRVTTSSCIVNNPVCVGDIKRLDEQTNCSSFPPLLAYTLSHFTAGEVIVNRRMVSSSAFTRKHTQTVRGWCSNRFDL